MKHKLLQTWARKSAKLLAAVALLATTSGTASATDAVLDSNDYSSDYTFGTQKVGEITFTATNNGSGNGVKYFASTSSFLKYGCFRRLCNYKSCNCTW